jgi:phosphoribosylaminoimidazole-succinocarboxamide synthase
VVVRGYLSGSGWRSYTESGAVCGHVLPGGLRESDRLPQPLVTPATKAPEGHDLNITEDEAAELCGSGPYAVARAGALALYAFASSYARERGIIVADTKFEFGVAEDGTVLLADEALTPDSSRFWPAAAYVPGGPQASYDKQFVRDWCDRVDWDKTPPGPELPADVVAGTRARYLEVFERLTRIPFAEYLADPEVVRS